MNSVNRPVLESAIFETCTSSICRLKVNATATSENLNKSLESDISKYCHLKEKCFFFFFHLQILS